MMDDSLTGTASLAGFDILTQQTQLRKKIGYCPQFNSLLDVHAAAAAAAEPIKAFLSMNWACVRVIRC